jgi:peptidyl-prolyl cis-trans isomerase A (cyclophilin A)
MRNSLRGAAAVLLFVLAGCGGSPPAAKETPAPAKKPPRDVYRVKFETTAGNFTVEVTRAWAPFGADRFYELVQEKFFDDARFYRVIRRYIAQFGVPADPAAAEKWRGRRLVDDPPKEKNRRGTLAFAQSGPNTRTTHVFVNLADNSRLDSQGFVPFGRVVEGIETIDKITFLYGETANDPKIEAQGQAYLKSIYPRLDYIKAARLVSPF